MTKKIPQPVAEHPSNPALLKAMQQVARQDNVMTRKLLYKALLESTLLLPTPADSPQVPPPLLMGRNAEGSSVLLAFTDIEALRAWRAEDSYYLGVPAREAFRFALERGAALVALNPAGPISGDLHPHEIQALAHGHAPGDHEAVTTEEVAGQTEVNIQAATGDFAPSAALVQQIQAQARHYPYVAAVYLFMLQLPQASPALAAGVVLGDVPPKAHQVEATMKQFVNATTPQSDIDQTLIFMVLERELLAHVAQHFSPIYEAGQP